MTKIEEQRIYRNEQQKKCISSRKEEVVFINPADKTICTAVQTFIIQQNETIDTQYYLFCWVWILVCG